MIKTSANKLGTLKVTNKTVGKFVWAAKNLLQSRSVPQSRYGMCDGVIILGGGGFNVYVIFLWSTSRYPSREEGKNKFSLLRRKRFTVQLDLGSE